MAFPFRPSLAGATLHDRAFAAVGALVGIAITALAGLVAGAPGAAIVAPMGASAVLVFAVPSSPLAQPWSVIGGNTLSALVGVASLHLFGNTPLGAGVAVGVAIFVMSLTRSLHPPGGAAALLAVVTGAGWSFVLLPVAINALVLVATGIAFHRLSGHSYPHRARPTPAAPDIADDDLDRALADAGDAFDIARDDLIALVRLAEGHALARRAGPPRR